MNVVKSKTLPSGVTQTDYLLDTASDQVPFVVWTPDVEPSQRGVLIAMAHGGSQHKKTEAIRHRAIQYAKDYGWVSMAVDAPGHGDRVTREQAAVDQRETAARVRGRPIKPSLSVTEKIQYLDDLAAQAVPEWQQVLTQVLANNIVQPFAALGFWGISMGSSIGIPLLASDTRYQCAVLGLSELLPDHHTFAAKARSITIPLRFIFQWDDPIRNRVNGLNLFDAFGSDDKSMHINPGGHMDFPQSETDSWDSFYQRHLEQK